MDGETHHHIRPRRRALTSAAAATATTASPPPSSRTEDTTTYKEDYSDDQLLTLPAGWVIKLVAIQAELIASCLLSLLAPLLYLYFQSQTIPSRAAHGVATLLRRLVFGLLGAVYAIAVLVAVMVASVLLGVGLVRLWMEEPVFFRQPLHFDYTQVHPTAAVALKGGRAVPAGHTVRVSLVLLLPESDYNRRIGIFQIHAEVISSTGEIIATSSQPYMLRFRSLPVRLMRTFLMGVPFLLGICSESQRIATEILTYKETRRRSAMIRVRLKPRAGTTDLPQLYEAEVLMKSQLPWAKQLVYNWKWTFYVWASLYMYIMLLILLVCYWKSFVIPRLRSRTAERRPSEVDKDHYRKERVRDLSDRFSDSLRRWRERGKRKAVLLPRAHRPEMVEGSASSSVRGGVASEIIDDSGDFAASESSECVGG